MRPEVMPMVSKNVEKAEGKGVRIEKGEIVRFYR